MIKQQKTIILNTQLAQKTAQNSSYHNAKEILQTLYCSKINEDGNVKMVVTGRNVLMD